MGSYISEPPLPLPPPNPDLIAPLPPKDVLLSLRTGKVRPLGGVKILSGINKQARQGPVQLAKAGLAGDERQFPPHRSPDNALFQYDPRHYAYWRSALPPGRAHLCKVGAFGENLSMAHLSEDNVCVGDTFRLGPDALVQVTMPRQPCFKLNHRFEYRPMSRLTQSTGYTGWYYRVLEEGCIQEGDEMVLVERLNPAWSIARMQHFTYTEPDNMRACAEIVRLTGLSQLFLDLFQKRLSTGGGVEDMGGRLNGDTAVLWRSYRLVQKKPLTQRVQKFVFAAEEDPVDDLDDADDLQFGRFPHVRLKFGRPGDDGDAQYTRAYSVVAGDMRSFELGIAKDDHSRGGSLFLHDEFAVGDVLKVAKGHSAPRSTTKGGSSVQEPPQAGIRKHVFVVGGIGVTAFIGEIRALAAAAEGGEVAGSATAAEVEVHYAVRSRREAAYLSLLPPERTTVYAKSDGQRLDVEKVIPPLPKDALHPDVMVYCCGPTPLLEACRERCERLGYPRSHTHFEEFGGAATGTGDPFEAEIKSTGRQLQVPREKSLLQVLNEAGFEIEASCNVGNCGTCMVDYCRGEVVHKGVALDEEQKRDTMLSCVSRGKGRVVIDC
ncbi:hypothetical protein SLS62_002634 [Diatrype stigma]|uniref:Phthalate dioxygenase reductase n=1 Tax=Diatrype stigma TaxID=117547 RepID=A0AAN9UY99_9PEZI